MFVIEFKEKDLMLGVNYERPSAYSRAYHARYDNDNNIGHGCKIKIVMDLVSNVSLDELKELTDLDSVTPIVKFVFESEEAHTMFLLKWS